MKNKMSAILCSVAVVLAADSLSAQALDLKRIEVVADSLAHAYIQAGTTPGITVAVAQDGQVLFTRGYGLADRAKGTAATPETVYNISSVTKQFTAATVMRLAEQGKISLDDPITKVLPDYPVQGRTVTVHHLLSHTSGLNDYAARYEPRPDWMAHDLSYQEMVEMWGKQPMEFEPGTKYDYNNMGYYLLGETVSRVTRTPFEDYLDLDVLRPLGLEHTANCDAGRASPVRASGYLNQDDKLVDVPYRSMRLFRAGGGLCSTVGDLVRWTHLLHSGKVVVPASVERMTTRTVLGTGDTIPRGYGLYLDELVGHPKIWHGGTFGYGHVLSHYPKNGLTIVVLTNATRGRDAAMAIEEAMARIAFGIEVRDLPLTAQDAVRYEGTYTYADGEETRELRIFGEEGRLMARIDNGKPFRLRYQGGHTFLHDRDNDIRLVFAGDDARVETFTLHWGRRPLAGRRQGIQHQ